MRHHITRHNRTDRVGGFTILEVVITVLVLLVIVGFAVPRLGAGRHATSDAIAKATLTALANTAFDLHDRDGSFREGNALNDLDTGTHRADVIGNSAHPDGSTSTGQVSFAATLDGNAFGAAVRAADGSCWMIQGDATRLGATVKWSLIETDHPAPACTGGLALCTSSVPGDGDGRSADKPALYTANALQAAYDTDRCGAVTRPTCPVTTSPVPTAGTTAVIRPASWPASLDALDGVDNVTAVSASVDWGMILTADGTVIAAGADNAGGRVANLNGLTGIVDIAAGGNAGYALRADGTVFAAGNNYNGEVDVVNGLTGVIDIAAGMNGFMALHADGTISAGAFDDEETDAATISGLDDVIAIEASYRHALAIRSDGTLVVVGQEGYGEVLDIDQLPEVSAVSSYNGSALAINYDCEVVVAGDLSQLGALDGLTGIRAVAAGSGPHAAVHDNGDVTAAGDDPYNLVPALDALTGVITLDIGYFAIAIIETEPSSPTTTTTTTTTTPPVLYAAQAWGDSDDGEAPVPAGLTDVIQVEAGRDYNMALNRNGTIAVWGDLAHPVVADVPSLNDVTQISAGSWHALALRSDGTVVSWGSNATQDYGQFTVPPGLSNVVQVDAASYHNLARHADGTVTYWGAHTASGSHLVPAGLDDVVDIAAGLRMSAVVRSDGSVVTWGDTTGPSPAVTSGALKVDLTHSRGIILLDDGTVRQWGPNFPCGTTCSATPAGLSDVIDISIGVDNAMVAHSDGTVTRWGANWPLPSPNPSGVKQVSVGYDTFMALYEP